jgi:hypothetical protein
MKETNTYSAEEWKKLVKEVVYENYSVDYSEEEWFKEMKEEAACYNVELTSNIINLWNEFQFKANIPDTSKQYLDWCDNHSVSGYSFSDYLRDRDNNISEIMCLLSAM